MSNDTSNESPHDVVTSVFEDLIHRLRDDQSIDNSVIERLESSLLKTKDSSVDKLRCALFPEDSDL